MYTIPIYESTIKGEQKERGESVMCIENTLNSRAIISEQWVLDLEANNRQQRKVLFLQPQGSTGEWENVVACDSRSKRWSLWQSC